MLSHALVLYIITPWDIFSLTVYEISPSMSTTSCCMLIYHFKGADYLHGWHVGSFRCSNHYFFPFKSLVAWVYNKNIISKTFMPCIKPRNTNLLGQGGKEAHICVEAIGLLGGKERGQRQRSVCVCRESFSFLKMQI